MVRKIHQEEATLQKKWLAKSVENGDGSNLAVDGLLFRGPINFKEGCWQRNSSNEEQLWNDSPVRLAILTKDLNDVEGWDIRQETGRRNTIAFDYESAIPFYKNLRMFTYGILNYKAGKCPTFQIASNMNISGPYYEQAPLVRINCKKQCGGATISDKSLEVYLDRYADLLRHQIEIYDANIFLCCGCRNGKNLILNYLKSYCLTDLEQVPGTNNWIYNSPSTGKIAINSYHPSARLSYEHNYNDMISAYEYAMNMVKNETKINKNIIFNLKNNNYE